MVLPSLQICFYDYKHKHYVLSCIRVHCSHEEKYVGNSNKFTLLYRKYCTDLCQVAADSSFCMARLCISTITHIRCLHYYGPYNIVKLSWYVIVLPQARVHCLKYKHKPEGRRPEGMCVYWQAIHECLWYKYYVPLIPV